MVQENEEQEEQQQQDQQLQQQQDQQLQQLQQQQQQQENGNEKEEEKEENENENENEKPWESEEYMNNGYKLTLTCDLKANEDIFLVDHFWITDYLHSRQQLHQLQIQNENVVKRIIQILDIQPNQDSNLLIYLFTYLFTSKKKL